MGVHIQARISLAIDAYPFIFMKRRLREELAKLDEGKYYELTFISDFGGAISTVYDVVRVNSGGQMVIIYTRDTVNGGMLRMPFRYELDDDKVQTREIYGDEQKKWAKYELFNGGSKPV